jgi:hypothetical protein
MARFRLLIWEIRDLAYPACGSLVFGVVFGKGGGA